eukprot:CAMPEP_0119362308 /NCGR_PEP_ID=MMETSP1334-20130426/9401_1 /TAXON_ID=127549 /ORGANISM="Calcidiscus leptoporus, Strain RCC1130" /LENGTH=352 /DNA_ID=CAMNT_0007377501 /DNA_START=34 /DNA_END=1092 /DNA_ORIENTATION=-
MASESIENPFVLTAAACAAAVPMHQRSTVSYNSRDILVYALGVGCRVPRFLWEEHPEFAPFPLFPAVLSFKGRSHGVVPYPHKELLPLMALCGVRGVLDGELHLEYDRPLPVPARGLSGDNGGDGGESSVTLELSTHLEGISQKRTGAVIHLHSELYDTDCHRICTMRTALFAVGASGYSRSDETREHAPAAARDWTRVRSERVAEAVYTETIGEHISKLYRLSGDYNPIHIDDETAQAHGLDGAVMHGRCTMAFGVRAVLDTFAHGDPSALSAAAARFASPVPLGSTLVTRMWRETRPTPVQPVRSSPERACTSRVYFETEVKESGRLALTHAWIDVLTSSSTAMLGQSRL